MGDKLQIKVNLSIENSGGEANLPIVIDAVKEAIVEKYPDAEVQVIKGFFQTIDGIWSNDSSVDMDVRGIVFQAREKVLNS